GVDGRVGRGLRMRGGAPGSGAAAVSVRIQPMKRVDLTEIVSAPGQLQPKIKVSISAKTTARIMDLPFDEGATVHKNDIIVQLDSKDLQAQLDAAEAHHAAQAGEIQVGEARLGSLRAQIESAKVQLADAERDLRRQNE